jgi:hypothetical protein
MARIDDNMALCERAIKETGVRKLVSDNKPFSGFGDVYHFLIKCMRLEDQLGNGDSLQSRGPNRSLPSRYGEGNLLYLLDADEEREVLNERQQIALVIQSDVLSKKAKGKAVKEKMNRLGVAYFDLRSAQFDEVSGDLTGAGGFRWHGSPDNTVARGKDESRARLYGVGNCQEKSATTVNWLTQHNTGNRPIAWVCLDSDHQWRGRNGDHAFAFFDIDPRNQGRQAFNIADVGDNCVIIDGWTGDWYPAKHPYKFWKSMANPFQMGVRVLIHNFGNGHINLKEWIDNTQQQVGLDSEGEGLAEVVEEVVEEIENNPKPPPRRMTRTRAKTI